MIRLNLAPPMHQLLAGELLPEGPVVLSLGMGLESTAILARWLLDPSSRPFELSRLVVMVAHTGDEWAETYTLTERHVLPLLAEHGVRFIQCARTGQGTRAADCVILDDSRAPAQLLHADPRVFPLSAEWRRAGTIQPSGGTRKCSIKAKGWPLDFAQRALLAELDASAYTHVLGFNAQELGRVRKDASYGGLDGVERSTWYPLLDWGWGRDECTEYLLGALGVDWPKSCCVQCPFAGQGAERGCMEARYRAQPDQAAFVADLELAALAFNPRMALYGERAMSAGLTDEARELLDARRAAGTWGVWRVRRAWNGSATPPRALELVTEHADQATAEAALRQRQPGAVRDGHGILRAMLAGRPKDRAEGGTYGLEEAWVVAPSTAGSTKVNVAFANASARLGETARAADVLGRALAHLASPPTSPGQLPLF